MNRLSGEELAGAVTDFVNGFNPDQKAFIDRMLSEHPTLQQSSMRLIFELIKAMAKQRYKDARNERAVEVCKHIVSQCGDEMYLPLI